MFKRCIKPTDKRRVDTVIMMSLPYQVLQTSMHLRLSFHVPFMVLCDARMAVFMLLASWSYDAMRLSVFHQISPVAQGSANIRSRPSAMPCIKLSMPTVDRFWLLKTSRVTRTTNCAAQMTRSCCYGLAVQFGRTKVRSRSRYESSPL